MMAKSWVSDNEREVLSAVARLATSNPFLPDRVADERRALGEAFVRYSPVWHMDGKLAGINPNLEPLRRVTEELAESLRSRLAAGARATDAELLLYEGFIRHLLFYRYHADLTALITDREQGKQATGRVAGYGRFRADYDHFLRLDGLRLPVEVNAAHVFAWGFQIRRAFHHTYWQIFGSSACMAELRAAVWRSIFTHDIERYRRALFDKMADIPTLVLGESGTGKELVSRAIGLSRYIPFDEKKEAFAADFAEGHQAVNLQALSASLVESELFGHKRGAFTGADVDRAGWLESCGRFGTIFLDEVGELDPAIQVKLLRVLQDRVFQRIGEVEDRRFEGKIVAATNRDLL
ncbi:MAG: sigma 54-interacting transcriptional regulator, partial [Myxococcales bacterium]|nr:sigma 54-interacting transcriptional regulator [Myxococcales bacterium]